MGSRWRAAAVVLFVVAAILLLWPWHRIYEGRRVTCGPAILAFFPNDPVGLRGAERRASDRCESFALEVVVAAQAVSLAGGYALIRANRGRRYPPPRPMEPPLRSG